MNECLVPQLKSLLRNAKLPVSGRKAALIDRLARAGIRDAECANKKSKTRSREKKVPTSKNTKDRTSQTKKKAAVATPTKKRTSRRKTTNTSTKKRPAPITTPKKRPAPITSPKKKTVGDYVKYTVAELKNMLRKVHKPVSGRKAVLIARLLDNSPPPRRHPPGTRPAPTPPRRHPPSPLPSRDKLLTDTEINDLSRYVLRQLLSEIGVDVDVDDNKLTLRNHAIEKRVTHGMLEDLKKDYLYLSSHQDPTEMLARVSAAKDPEWRRLYMKLHSDYKHPTKSSDKLRRDDLESTPELISKTRRVDVRQPFPTDFAKKMSLKDLREFVSSYYGDVLVEAIAVEGMNSRHCDLLEFFPEYLTTRFHLDHGFTVGDPSQPIELLEKTPETSYIPWVAKQYMRKGKPFVMPVLLIGFLSSEHSSHANYIIVSPRTMRAYLFEPHNNIYTEVHEILAKLLPKELGVSFYGLVPNIQKVQHRDYLCSSWSYYFAMMILVNPDIDGGAITRAMTKRNLVRFFAWLTFDIPQQGTCDLSGSFQGWKTSKGDTLGFDALTSTTGSVVKEAIGSKIGNTRFGTETIYE